MREVLTVKEVANYLRVSRTTVWRWCHEGTLRSFRLGNVYRIHREELERHVGVRLAATDEDSAILIEEPNPNGEVLEI